MTTNIIPELKEIPASRVDTGHMIWGWFDAVCQSWHVSPHGSDTVTQVESDNGGRAIYITLKSESVLCLGPESRMLVEL